MTDLRERVARAIFEKIGFSPVQWELGAYWEDRQRCLKAADAAIAVCREDVQYLVDTLKTIAAQSSGVRGSTSLPDCMAALARVAVSNYESAIRSEGGNKG